MLTQILHYSSLCIISAVAIATLLWLRFDLDAQGQHFPKRRRLKPDKLPHIPVGAVISDRCCPRALWVFIDDAGSGVVIYSERCDSLFHCCSSFWLLWRPTQRCQILMATGGCTRQTVSTSSPPPRSALHSGTCKQHGGTSSKWCCTTLQTFSSSTFFLVLHILTRWRA